MMAELLFMTKRINYIGFNLFLKTVVICCCIDIGDYGHFWGKNGHKLFFDIFFQIY